uniref:Uncharacterized protein n=1 Tax=Arundo donax TaxID=35708 RepID=A0A0A9HNG8_ARUDO
MRIPYIFSSGRPIYMCALLGTQVDQAGD